MRSRTCHRPVALALAVIAVCQFAISPAWSIYMRPDLEEIPVERLIGSLQAKTKDAPDDVTLRLNLARAHAMAFTSKGKPVKVLKGKADQGIWFDFEPKNIPFGTVVMSDDEAVKKAAEEQLKLAIEAYEKVLEMNKEHITARLGYAWCLQQTDDKDKALDEYRQVVKVAWEKEEDMDVAPLGFHSIVTEAAAYMTGLLDENADAAEIADVKAKAAKTSIIPRPITPIAIPLHGGLALDDLIDSHAAVRFDADGTARDNSRWSWISPDAGWLVYDQTGRGQIRSGLQLFGNVTFWMFWENGYQPLSLLDTDQSGELRGDELRHLAIWRDANSNGISDPGEVRPLTEHGIVALSCQGELPPQLQAANPEPRDCVAWAAEGVTFADGTTRATYDIVLHERTSTHVDPVAAPHGQKETP